MTLPIIKRYELDVTKFFHNLTMYKLRQKMIEEEICT